MNGFWRPLSVYAEGAGVSSGRPDRGGRKEFPDVTKLGLRLPWRRRRRERIRIKYGVLTEQSRCALTAEQNHEKD